MMAPVILALALNAAHPAGPQRVAGASTRALHTAPAPLCTAGSSPRRADAPSRVSAVRMAAAGEPFEVGPTGAGRLGRRTMRLDFTCKACDTRTSRFINPEAYKTGVCIVQCANPECGKRHVIADNIDFLERGFANVVEWAKANGLPSVLLAGAEQLPRSLTVVTEEDADDGQGEAGARRALDPGAER